MDKLKMHSPNFTDENIAKLAELFPSCVTESMNSDGELTRAIDFDQLKQELSNNIVDGPQERYQLNWPGKREALLAANAPIAKTLRPCREESVDFDTTENLFIEGDNLDALKLLQETYLGKVKIIYIDPPYNTGNDFIYADDFSESSEEYLIASGQKDEKGSRLVANTDTNGRFHSDWLSMIYSRLKLARNLLADDGYIVISIDDNEVANLRKILDEIFGETNFIADVAWKHTQQSKNDEQYFARVKNSLLFYRKSSELNRFRLPRTEEDNKNYSNHDSDPKGKWRSGDVRSPSLRSTLRYEIETPCGNIIQPPVNGWRWSKPALNEKISSGEISFVDNETRILRKIYLSNQDGRTPENVWDSPKFGSTRVANTQIKELFDNKNPFDTPKPTHLVRSILDLISTESDYIVLDFFAGSSSTAQGVIEKNGEDNGNRRFIMVQLQEGCNEKSEAFKDGYQTIAEISKERIRRAGQKIKKDSDFLTPDLDVGFRVLKVDESNMADVYYAPDSVNQADLSRFSENIKEGRSSEDLLFQVLLDRGVDLTLPINKETIAGREVFFVDGNALVACFDKEGQVDETFCKELAARKLLRVVFRDAGFKDDSVKINVEQIFKLLSPNTNLKTI